MIADHIKETYILVFLYMDIDMTPSNTNHNK